VSIEVAVKNGLPTIAIERVIRVQVENAVIVSRDDCDRAGVSNKIGVSEPNKSSIPKLKAITGSRARPVGLGAWSCGIENQRSTAIKRVKQLKKFRGTLPRRKRALNAPIVAGVDLAICHYGTVRSGSKSPRNT
jgi:hypothetical protein